MKIDHKSLLAIQDAYLDFSTVGLQTPENARKLRAVIDKALSLVGKEPDERKVEELEEKVQGHHTEIGQAHDRLHNHWKYIHPLAKKAGLFDDQPQPKGGVVRCKDEKGVEHDLIPGVSVVAFQFASGDEQIFLFRHTADKDQDLYGYPASCIHTQSFPTCYRAKFCIWLRNLDFPQDSGSSKGAK